MVVIMLLGSDQFGWEGPTLFVGEPEEIEQYATDYPETIYFYATITEV